MEIIARIENGFREKFGVPRQSGLVPEVISRVVMAEKYSVREAFRGIEDYSHLWLLWEFDRAQQDDWRPTVRPPRLGGNTRLGVFATRSPFRPNRIGLTVVRLIRMEEENGRITLVVSGADLMDGTPIVDIKPYLPYVDSVPDAIGGFTEQTERHRLTVDFPEKLKKYVPKQNLPAVMGLLAQDPRPAYQHDGKRVYGVPYGEVDIRFVVEGDTLTVVEVVPYTEKEQEMGYAARMEENKAICTNRNIVVGDVDKAKVLVTAHYDTPATVGLPNLMLPMNRPMFYLVQALIALVMVVFIFIPTGIVKKLTGSIFCTEATLIGLYCLMMYLLLAGVPNPHNVNDNTSGVCGVLALMESFAAEKPEEIAFVLFDNEEKGLLGASGLAKAHKQAAKETLVLNMDCIGVGEAMLMLVPKAAREKYPALGETARKSSGIPVVLGNMEKCNFSSDQKHFKLGVGICACRKKKHVGWYCSKIHTKHDTTYDEITLQGVADTVEAVLRQVVGKEQA